MDLEGWQQTRWGMSDAEIVNAVGGEHIKRNSRANYQNLYSDLHIPNVEVGPYYFDVIFQMEDASERLGQVLIAYDADDATDLAGALKATRKVLQEKFGEPTRVGTSDDWAWTFPTTTILLSSLAIEDITYRVAVIYRPTSNTSHSNKVSAF